MSKSNIVTRAIPEGFYNKIKIMCNNHMTYEDVNKVQNVSKSVYYRIRKSKSFAEYKKMCNHKKKEDKELHPTQNEQQMIMLAPDEWLKLKTENEELKENNNVLCRKVDMLVYQISLMNGALSKISDIAAEHLPKS